MAGEERGVETIQIFRGQSWIMCDDAIPPKPPRPEDIEAMQSTRPLSVAFGTALGIQLIGNSKLTKQRNRKQKIRSRSSIPTSEGTSP